MLTHLSIQNIVLIEKLNLDMQQGMTVLTGETGAGKSILLDSLGLVLGARAETSLVRNGSDNAKVTAIFDLHASPIREKIAMIFEESGIDMADDIIIKRELSSDGKSKAFINDEPVTINLLKKVGVILAEVHGQFDTMRLLNPKEHLSILDSFASHDVLLRTTEQHYTTWQVAQKSYNELFTQIDKDSREQDFLRHVVDKISELNPQEGEEEILSAKRQKLLSFEKIVTSLQQADQILNEEGGIQSLLNRTDAVLDGIINKLDTDNQDSLSKAIRAAQAEIENLSYEVQKNLNDMEGEEESLSTIETRLFALKDLARQQNVAVAELPQLRQDLEQRLKLIDQGQDQLHALKKKAEQAQADYQKAAIALTQSRHSAAQKLQKLIMTELPILKMERAAIDIEILSSENPADWSAKGMDQVTFLATTNIGSACGPLNKVASGGELSRFMLAFKIALMDAVHIPVMVFDEIDSGVGGSTAHAIGERLATLANKSQILIVTHSPQVAARGTHHWFIAKQTQDNKTTTSVSILNDGQRREEIARMLSGDQINDAARDAADILLKNDKQRKSA